MAHSPTVLAVLAGLVRGGRFVRSLVAMHKVHDPSDDEDQHQEATHTDPDEKAFLVAARAAGPHCARGVGPRSSRRRRDDGDVPVRGGRAGLSGGRDGSDDGDVPVRGGRAGLSGGRDGSDDGDVPVGGRRSRLPRREAAGRLRRSHRAARRTVEAPGDRTPGAVWGRHDLRQHLVELAGGACVEEQQAQPVMLRVLVPQSVGAAQPDARREDGPPGLLLGAVAGEVTPPGHREQTAEVPREEAAVADLGAVLVDEGEGRVLLAGRRRRLLERSGGLLVLRAVAHRPEELERLDQLIAGVDAPRVREDGLGHPLVVPGRLGRPAQQVVPRRLARHRRQDRRGGERPLLRFGSSVVCHGAPRYAMPGWLRTTRRGSRRLVPAATRVDAMTRRRGRASREQEARTPSLCAAPDPRVRPR